LETIQEMNDCVSIGYLFETEGVRGIMLVSDGEGSSWRGRAGRTVDRKSSSFSGCSKIVASTEPICPAILTECDAGCCLEAFWYS
jgi:hypothetical protein